MRDEIINAEYGKRKVISGKKNALIIEKSQYEQLIINKFSLKKNLILSKVEGTGTAKDSIALDHCKVSGNITINTARFNNLIIKNTTTKGDITIHDFKPVNGKIRSNKLKCANSKSRLFTLNDSDCLYEMSNSSFKEVRINNTTFRSEDMIDHSNIQTLIINKFFGTLILKNSNINNLIIRDSSIELIVDSSIVNKASLDNKTMIDLKIKKGSQETVLPNNFWYECFMES